MHDIQSSHQQAVLTFCSQGQLLVVLLDAVRLTAGNPRLPTGLQSSANLTLGLVTHR